MIRYAAYGSNLHPLRLRGRTPSAELTGTAIVDGWSLKFHKRGKDGSGKCNIVAAPGSVFFALYEIDERDKSELDAIEGIGFGYEERYIQIPGFGEHYFYAASESHIDNDLQPYTWYRALVLTGLEYHEAPAHHRQQVRAVAARQDHATSRHRQHMDIVSAARQVI